MLAYAQYARACSRMLVHAQPLARVCSRMLADAMGVCIHPRLAAYIEKVYALALNVGICASHNLLVYEALNY